MLSYLTVVAVRWLWWLTLCWLTLCWLTLCWLALWWLWWLTLSWLWWLTLCKRTVLGETRARPAPEAAIDHGSGNLRRTAGATGLEPATCGFGDRCSAS
jgi:hypothetical protein